MMQYNDTLHMPNKMEKKCCYSNIFINLSPPLNTNISAMLLNGCIFNRYSLNFENNTHFRGIFIFVSTECPVLQQRKCRFFDLVFVIVAKSVFHKHCRDHAAAVSIAMSQGLLYLTYMYIMYRIQTTYLTLIETKKKLVFDRPEPNSCLLLPCIQCAMMPLFSLFSMQDSCIDSHSFHHGRPLEHWWSALTQST